MGKLVKWGRMQRVRTDVECLDAIGGGVDASVRDGRDRGNWREAVKEKGLAGDALIADAHM
jgi:hypothetical protein